MNTECLFLGTDARSQTDREALQKAFCFALLRTPNWWLL